jgi:hypothetical protein
MLRGAQYKPDGEGGIDAKQGDWHKHDRERGIEAAKAHIVYGIGDEAQYRFGEVRQRQQVERGEAHDRSEHGR